MKCLAAVITLALAVSPALAQLSKPEDAEMAAKVQAGPVSNAVAIAEAKKAILSQLKDPSSAEFSGVLVTGHIGPMVTVCGFINAKNGFGGYAGKRVFYYQTIIEMPHILSADPSAEERKLFEDVCLHK